MANKYSGFAATLQISISAVFTSIAGVRDISGPSMSQDTIEVSSRDLAWKEYVGGMLDGGEVTFDIVYDPDTSTHSATAAGGAVLLLTTGTKGTYKLSFADTTPATASFGAFVTKFTPKAPFNGMQAADVTLKITGAITWA